MPNKVKSVKDNSFNSQMRPDFRGKTYEAGHFVVKPPDNFYRFSVFDELDLNRNTYKEFLSKYDPVYISRQKRRRADKIVEHIVKGVVAMCAFAVIYKCAGKIKNTAVTVFNSVKNFVKK